MTEPDPIETALRNGLHRCAEQIDARPGPVSTIERRSRRRRTRARAAGAMAGAGALVLAAGAVTRDRPEAQLTAASDLGAGTGTTGPPGTGTTIAAAVPTTATIGSTIDRAQPSTTAVADGGSVMVPDSSSTGMLRNDLRIVVEPPAGLVGGQLVTVRGSNFTPGSSVLLIMCTTDGLSAQTLADGAGSCDIRTRYDVVADPNPNAPNPPPSAVGPDGTFTTTYRVERNLSTMAGATDCAAATVDASEARVLVDAGMLGPDSFPDGVWGCSVVAVVTGVAPVGPDGSTTEIYQAATAAVVEFAP